MNRNAWLIAVSMTLLFGPNRAAQSSPHISTAPSGGVAWSVDNVRDQEALETRIEAAAQIAYSIWRLERLRSALEQMHFETGDSNKASAVLGTLNAALRSDQQMSIDTYAKLVREIGSVPEALAVNAAMAGVEAEFVDGEHPAMKIMLRTLAEHAHAARNGNIPTRDQMLDDIVTHSAKRR